MNKDAIINRIAYFTGESRKEVLEVLRKAGFLHDPKDIPDKPK
jgi:hypothetical protein